MISLVRGAIGEVHSVNLENYTARIKLMEYEERITGFIPILTNISKNNKEVCIPSIGTPVFAIFFGDDNEHGFIIGSFFTNQNKSNSEKGVYNLDFQNSKLKINENGEINITAIKTTIDSDVEITKSLKVTGKVNISDSLNVEKTIDSKLDITSQMNVKGKKWVKI